ncbi:T9SS type A sorting domain-containing protein [Fluviicola taffensis]|uniref:T9SS type A sorting domain-containing protein n=1 Tax=Fluviicola taffensis TaxID=191579 RepID=UPI0031384925
MKNNTFKKWLTLSALFAFMCFSPHALLKAQSSANYTFSTNATGSLVDMSTGTTQLIGPGLDAATSGLAPIGFSFQLMGNVFTQFSVNEDAVMQLGGTAIGANIYTISAGTIALPRLAAFNADLRTGTTTGKVHYKVIGAAPNRQLVVEFLNMQLFYTTTGTAGTSTFQMILSETTGQIDYVYGTMSATDVATGNRAASIGFYTGAATNSFASVAFATHTNSTVAAYAANPNIAAVGPITDLTSAADGSRRVYSYVSPMPAAPTSLAFSGVGGFGMTLNWVDNATTEVGYQIYRSLDGITYNLIATTAANATSYNATSLTTSTLYYWKVLAISEGATSTPDLLGSQMTLSTGTLSGIKTVGSGGDYNNLTTAFNTINAQGLIGDVELQLIAGYPASPETYPIQSSNTASVGAFNVKVYPTVSGLSITSSNTTGTLNLNNAKNITFDGRVNQAGANDLIIANTNAGTSYAILLNNDASTNVIQNCIVQSTNTSTSSGTIVFGTTTGANGNDNNTISACDIRDGATTPFNAIYSVGTTATTAQFNDNNIITGNNISNFFSAGSSTVGVFVGGGNSTWTISNNKLFQTATRTYTSGNTHNGIQVSNTSGNGFVITGNTIGYASSTGTGTYTMAGTVATRFIGINISAGTTAPSSIQNNTITNFSLTTSSGATTGNGIFAGINVTGGNVNVGNITPNTIGSGTGTGAIVATTSTAGGVVVGINSSSSGTVNITGNTIGSINGLGSTATSPASITGIQVSGGTPTINGNTIGSTATANSINAITVATSGAQLVRGIDVTSGVTLATSIQSNTISNLTQSGTTTGGSIRGIAYAGTGIATISQNTISVITGANANTSLAGTGIQGILHSGSAAGGTISGNLIHTLIATNTGTVQSNVNGIGIAGLSAAVVSVNKIYNLQNASTGVTATTPPTASGIMVRSIGAGSNISNNMISLGDAQTTNTQFIGVWNSATSASAINIYHNSIHVEGTAGAGALPSFALLRGDNSGTSVTSTVDIRNNIFNNTRSGGTGKHYAIANQSTAPSATGWGVNASNFNMLNTANTATVGLWGSTDATFNAWRVAASSDANSFSALPVVFVNTATGDLHLNMGVSATPMESGGTTIAAVTTDFDAQSRPGPAGSVNGGGTSPDLGADEFDGVPALPVITINSVTPPAAPQCTTAPRLVSVNITTPTGTIIAANLGYSINGTPQTAIAMTNVSGTTWTATIPASTPANATISWAVSATNSSALSASINGTTYTDEPLTGVTSSVTASTTTLCAGSPTTLTASLSKNVSAVIGTATTLTGATAQPTAFCNRWSSYRMQTIYTAAELTAAGLSAGPITSMSFNITTLGDGATNANFIVKVGTTGLTAFTDFVATTGYTTVFPSAIYTHAVGVNVINFSTPYIWDGTSNIVVEVSHSGANSINNSQTYYTATAGNTVAWSTNGGATGTPSTNRLNVVFTGNGAPAISAISWSDGVGTVGTTTPLTVTPTATTTYTATITAAGCTVTPAPSVSVTVNPLPATPTAVNSAQCGTQVPTASVTSTSGLPTPSFKWYDAAVAGTVLQSGTSTTYTSTIAVTTTFYVSEINTVTGCESARVPVTVNVSSPDAISASTSAASVCENGSVTLTAVNTNPTPFQSYTYSWVSAAGSGAATPVAGNPVVITPTVAGTYTYTATGTDGGCSTTNTVVVTVNPNPSAVVAGANDTDICNGQLVNLSVTSTTGSPINPVTILSQNFDAGLGAWTTTYSGTAPAASGWFAQNAPFTYTTYFNNFATPQGGGFAMTNGDIGGSGLKTRAALISPTFSTVGMTSATLTFQNLYQKWNSGDSLVRLEISTDGGTSWATLKDYLPLGSQGVVTSGAQVPANESIVLGAPYLNQSNLKIRYNFVTAWGYYWVIDDVKIISTPVDPTTYAWTSAPAGFTSSVQNPTGVAPTVTTNYSVNITNSFGCSSTGSVNVVVNQPSSSSVSATACSSYTWAQNSTTYTTSGAYTATIPNAAGCDSVITLNLTINSPSASSVSVAACDTYTWAQNGMTYVTSGAYTDTVLNAVGCDSVITLNLTINHPTTATVNQVACQTYTWPINSTTYTTSGTHTATILNAAGCDSVITLNLTIGAPSASLVTQTACVSYTWPQTGQTYTVSGAYNDTVPNMFGCDSVITLSLTINQPTSSLVVESECVSFTWAQNGMTYTTSGIYTDTITNAAGCDSVITLNLTIVQPTSSSVSATACTTYTWAQNGMTYTASGAYTDTIPNMAGCDSIITLNLTINQPTTATVTVSTCNPSYTWAQSGMTYTASGMYNDTITNAAGCDSVVTLNLTIAPFVATATDNGNATATASAGTTYQWINCTTNSPIAGATAQTFVATANGTYAAIVSNGTCSDTTNCVTIANVGIKESMISTISVHPNPTHDVVVVTMEAASATVEVMDVQGKLIQTTQIKSGDQIDLSTYERGVYTLRIKTEFGTSLERIVKN